MADLLAIHLGVRPNKEKGGSAHEPSSAVETDCAASSCSEEDLAKLRAVVEQVCAVWALVMFRYAWYVAAGRRTRTGQCCLCLQEDTSALAQSVHEKLCDFIRTKGLASLFSAFPVHFATSSARLRPG